MFFDIRISSIPSNCGTDVVDDVEMYFLAILDAFFGDKGVLR